MSPDVIGDVDLYLLGRIPVALALQLLHNSLTVGQPAAANKEVESLTMITEDLAGDLTAYVYRHFRP